MCDAYRDAGFGQKINGLQMYFPQRARVDTAAPEVKPHWLSGKKKRHSECSGQ